MGSLYAGRRANTACTLADWLPDNVDYNEIKAIIKHHTSGSKAAAITIPGQTVHDVAFEEELYRELVDQHQRVDLFVRCKAGEIERRLAHLGRNVEQLRRRPPPSNRKKTSVRRREKFARLETETLRAGEEIQALARYIGVQKIAFIKLLKKYRKWTGASQLAVRFENNVVSKPRAFERQELGQLLLTYNNILAAVREPFEAGYTWKSAGDGSGQAKIPRASADASGAKPGQVLQDLFEEGSSLEFDTAFGVLPLGPRAGHVTYWVHDDNLLQLHILLLRNMRRKAQGSASTTPQQSNCQPPSPRDPLDTSLGSTGSNEFSSEIICDDLATFAKGRSSMTIEQLETRTWYRLQDAAATVRYTSTGESTIAVENGSQGSGQDCLVMRGTHKEKDLQSLFEGRHGLQAFTKGVSNSKPPHQSPSISNQEASYQSWCDKHQNVRPLVLLQSRKARFGGLSSAGEHGVWAILDRDVQMKTWSSGARDVEGTTKDTTNFPHAILEVRWEGEDRPKLVKKLDESHLVEQVPGFSLQVHAVSALYSADLPQPYWVRSTMPPPTFISNKDTSCMYLTATSARFPMTRPRISGAVVPLHHYPKTPPRWVAPYLRAIPHRLS